MVVFVLMIAPGCVEDRPLRLLPLSVAAIGESSDTHSLSAAGLGVSSVHLDGPAKTRATGWALVSVAHAHPGHGATGAVVGEWQGPKAVDLLAGKMELGTLGAYSGAVGSGRFALDSDLPVDWTGTLEHPESGAAVPFSYTTFLSHDTTTVPFTTTIPSNGSPGTLVLTIDLAEALSYVDVTIADSNGDGVLDSTDDAFVQSVQFGLTSASAWSLSLEP